MEASHLFARVTLKAAKKVWIPASRVFQRFDRPKWSVRTQQLLAYYHHLNTKHFLYDHLGIQM